MKINKTMEKMDNRLAQRSTSKKDIQISNNNIKKGLK